MTTAKARLLYFGCVVLLLVGVQARAQVVQVREGYRPLSHPPKRVPFSWDMFAIKIERCTVTWDPPINVEGKPLRKLQDRSMPIEFDSVFNDAHSYENAGRLGCQGWQGTTTVACAYSDGEVRERTFQCE